MDLRELQAAAAPGHVCDAACVAASEEEHDSCSAVPERHWCDECKRFTADHPGV